MTQLSSGDSDNLEVIKQTGLALLTLIAWLTALAYVQDFEPRLRLAFTALWIAAFIWLHFWRASRPENFRLFVLSHSIPKVVLPHILFLSLLVALSLPWEGALATGGCANSRWYERIWPANTTVIGPPLLSIALFLANTATFPLVEEFTFRGWLLSVWRKRWGTAVAVLVTSTLFALGHFRPTPGLVLSDFVFAIVLAAAVLSTRTLWSAFAMHYAYNLSNESMSRPPAHDLFGRIFQDSIFRCGSSLAIVTTAFCIALVVIFDAARRTSLQAARPMVKAD